MLFATPGTHDFLGKNGIKSQVVYWPDDSRTPNSLGLFKDKKVDLVINIPKDLSSTELNNDYSIRRGAVDMNIPILTNARLASAFITAFCSLSLDELQIKSMGEYEIVS